MDMFNKLKSAVSNALPGNPMSREFEIYGLIATAGPAHLWKIYSAVKKSTKQDAAVFVFEKKVLEKYSRRDRELITECLKKGASQLTRLRHPKILSVMQPLEESRESLAFATEPVFSSLSNLLGCHDNLPESVGKQLQEHQMYEVEIKYGLLQMAEGLQFLHNGVKLLHNNLCPESIIVNKNGSWKLAGFDFCIPNQNPSEQTPFFAFKDWEPDIAPCAQPNLDYLAPEYAITHSCGLACDMFSVGVLIYAVFNNGKPLYECKTQLNTFKKNAEELGKWRGSLLGKLPAELRDIVKLLLNTEPSVRPDPDQLSKISFFEDVGSMTLQYMDSLFQQDNLQKSKFFKGLPKIIVKFPKRVNIQRILPPLLKECVNPDMIPFVLPNVLQIAEQATEKEFTTHILPDLIPMFKITNPIQIMLIFMQNMSLLLKKTPGSDIKTHVLPMIYSALESGNPQIQELCLKIIPTFADLLDYTSLKNSIVPRIKKLCLTTSTIGVRVNSLLCLGQLLEGMDRWFVLDEVLPLLPQIPSREPAVLMSILGIYKVALTHAKLGITKDILAGKVIPFLMAISIDNNLNLGQFSAYMTLIREMIEKVETEHRSKLQQIDQMKQEQKNLEITKITESDDKTLIAGVDDDKPKSMMDQFLSGFGMLSMTSSKSPGSNINSSSQPVTPATAASSSPSLQPKVNLTMEEKQRLAREQEQQRFLKANKPLDGKAKQSPTMSSPHTKQQAPNSKPKDLTSSLMQSNVMGLSNTSSKPMPNYSNMNTGSMNSSFPGTMSQPSSIPSVNSSFNSGIPAANSSGFGANASSGFSQGGMAKKPVDLSSFDNLMSGNSQSQKKTMSQMSQGMGAQQGMMGNPGQQGMMGNSGQGMMGNSQQGIMGNSQQGMLGNPGQQGMMGQQNMMSGPGMMGGMMNTGFGGMQGSGNQAFTQRPMGVQQTPMFQPGGGQSMLQPNRMPAQNVTANSNSIGNQLDDLFS